MYLAKNSHPEYIKNSIRDFPGGPVVKNPPCNSGDTGSIPGQETKIPHARATKPACRNYRAHVLWSPPATTGLERNPRAAMKDPACRN